MESFIGQKFLTQTEIDAGAATQVGNMIIRNTTTGSMLDSGPAGTAASPVVTSANINTILQASGGAGWEKAQASTTSYVITRPVSGASLDLHIEVGGTLAALAVTNWPIPASGVDQLRIRNFSGVVQSFTATDFSGVVTADGNIATSGSYTIPIDMAVHITIDGDGWIQVAPMGQEVSQAELDAGLGAKADKVVAPIVTRFRFRVSAYYPDSVGLDCVQFKKADGTYMTATDFTVTKGINDMHTAAISTEFIAPAFSNAAPVPNGASTWIWTPAGVGGIARSKDLWREGIFTLNTPTEFTDFLIAMRKAVGVYDTPFMSVEAQFQNMENGTATDGSDGVWYQVWGPHNFNNTGDNLYKETLDIRASHATLKSFATDIALKAGKSDLNNTALLLKPEVTISSGYPTATVAKTFTASGISLHPDNILTTSFKTVTLGGTNALNQPATLIANTLNRSVANELTCWVGTFADGITKALKLKFTVANGIVSVLVTQANHFATNVLTDAAWTTAGGNPTPSSTQAIATSDVTTSYGLKNMVLAFLNATAPVSAVDSLDQLVLKAPIKAPVQAYSTAATYIVGDQVIQGSKLYRCNTAITVGEAFTEKKWTDVSGVMPAIGVTTNPIEIKIAGAAGAGTNYPVKITIGESGGATGANFNLATPANTFPAGKNASCSFLLWDSLGSIPFWIENVTGTIPNRVAHIWVAPKIDLSVGIKTIFLSIVATDEARSNGDSVFTLFDDFDSATLDATKWDTSVISGHTITSGILSFGGGNVARKLLTLNNVADGFEIMSVLRASDTNASSSNFGFEGSVAADAFKYVNIWDSNSKVMVGTTSNVLTTNINNAAGVRQLMRIGRASGAGRFSSENPVNTFSTAAGVPAVAGKVTVYNTYDNSTEIDWVAVKKFVAVEPVFSSAVNVEYISPNQHGNIYGIIYRQYFGATLPASLTAGNVVTTLIDHEIRTHNGANRYVTRGWTSDGSTSATLILSGMSGGGNLTMNIAGSFTVIGGWVDYTK